MRVLTETKLTFAEAAVRAGKSVRTIQTWAAKGYAGTVLESATVGFHRFTSAQALDRFIAACNAKVAK